MEGQFGEQFIIKFDADDSGIKSVLTNIINQAQSGVTVGIAMDADTTKVIQKIEQISDLMKQKIGSGIFDFNELFNFKNAVGELGTLASKFDQLAPIFNSYNDMANNLTASMTQLASLKLDAGQFSALKTTLEGINTSIQDIGAKLDGVGSNSGVEKVAKEAKEAAAEIDKAAQSAEKLGQKQKEFDKASAASTATQGRSGTFEPAEESLRDIIDLFTKMEASLASMKSVFVDVGDGQELSPLLTMIDKIEKSIKELATAASGIKLDVNLGLGSEANERTSQKVSQAMARQLEAYKKLFAAMKSTGKTNKEMLFFAIPDEADVAEAIGAYKNVISKAEKQFGKDTYKKLLGNDYNGYLREVQNATDQFNRATRTKNVNNPLGDLFGKTELTEITTQLGSIASKLDEIVANAGELKNAFQESFNISKYLEEVNQLTTKIKELEGELAKVRLAGSDTTVAGISGEQTSLEQVLQTTLRIQQQMAETVTTINSTISDSTKAAATAYDTLRISIEQVVEAVQGIKSFGVIDPVELQKANQKILELEERLDSVAAKSDEAKTKARIKDSVKENAASIQEEITATANETKAKEELQRISVSVLDKIAQEIEANETMIASTANKVKAVEALKHAYEALLAVQKMPLSKSEYEQFESNYIRSYASVLSSGVRNSVLEQYQIDGVDTFSVKEIVNAQRAFVNEENAIKSINKTYDLYLSKLQAANELRQNKLAAEIYSLPEEKISAISQQLVVAEEQLTNAWQKLNAEFANDPLNQARVSAENLERELQILSSGVIRFAGSTTETTTASTYKDLTIITKQLYAAKKQLLTADENQSSVLKEIISEKEQLIRVIRSQQISQELLSTDEENAYKTSLARHKQDLRIAEAKIKDKENALKTKGAYAELTQATKELYKYKTKLLSADSQEREELIKTIQLRAQAISNARQNIGTNTNYDQEIEYQKLLSSLKEGYRIDSSKSIKNKASQDEVETYSKLNALIKEIYALKTKSISIDKQFTEEDRKLLALKEKELNVTRAQMQIDSQSKHEKQYQTKLLLEQEKFNTQKLRSDSSYYTSIEDGLKRQYKYKTMLIGADNQEAQALTKIYELQKARLGSVQLEADDNSIKADKIRLLEKQLEAEYQLAKASYTQKEATQETKAQYSILSRAIREMYDAKRALITADEQEAQKLKQTIAERANLISATRKSMNVDKNSKEELAYQRAIYSEKAKLATLQSKNSKQYYADALDNEKALYQARTLRLNADKEEAAILDKIIKKRQKMSKSIIDDGSNEAKSYYASVAKLSDDYQRSVARNLDGLKDAYTSARSSIFVGNPSSFIQDNDTAIKINNLVTAFRTLDVQLKECGNDYSVFFARYKKDILEAIDGVNNLTAAEKEKLKNGLLYQHNKDGNYHSITNDQAISMSGFIPGTSEYQQALSKLASEILKVTLISSELDASGKKLIITYEGQHRATQTATIALDRYGDAIEGVRVQQGKTTQYVSQFSKFLEPLKTKLKELLRYFSAFMLVMRVINSVKEGIQTVRELDAALTELKVVTGANTIEMAKFQKQAQQVASAIASTTLEVTQSATEWSRLGYAMSDALELAEQSAIYSKIGATDINVATENLTATLQAFYSDDIRDGIISAGDAAEEIVDKLVNVGDKFASSAEGMGQGISAAGSALIAANNSLDESLALITAGTTILQDENETASALRTISLRLRGTKASELEAAGEDADGAIEDISKLYKLVKDMTSINGGKGVEIFNTDTGAYKSTYEILLEISKVWDDMSDLQQAGLLEAVAGKTRSNAAAAILSSQEILEDAYAASTESAGVAAEKMEVYLNSIESHIAEFKQATSVMWENTLSTDFVKGFVDLGTAIVKVTDKVGLLSVALAGVFGYFGAKGQGRHINQGVSIKYA